MQSVIINNIYVYPSDESTFRTESKDLESQGCPGRFAVLEKYNV